MVIVMEILSIICIALFLSNLYFARNFIANKFLKKDYEDSIEIAQKQLDNLASQRDTVRAEYEFVYGKVAELNQQKEELLGSAQSLSQEISNKQFQVGQLQESINAQTSVVNSLRETADNLRESAEDQAKKSAEVAFRDKTLALQQDYDKQQVEFQQKQEELNQQLAACQTQIASEQDKLAALKAKQDAYIQAQLREEAIAADTSFFSLALDEITLNDIKLLRELQAHFIKKDAIDKLIWEVYYKPAYDILMAHLELPAGQKIVGIYKLTDRSTGQIYIGQSLDIRERFRTHIKTALAYGTATNKLYQCMKKSGLENFTFEILEKGLAKNDLNEREKYYIDFYQSKEMGLNKTSGGS